MAITAHRNLNNSQSHLFDKRTRERGESRTIKRTADSIRFDFIIYMLVRRVCVCDYYYNNNSYRHDHIYWYYVLIARINERESPL